MLREEKTCNMWLAVLPLSKELVGLHVTDRAFQYRVCMFFACARYFLATLVSSQNPKTCIGQLVTLNCEGDCACDGPATCLRCVTSIEA